MTLVNQEGMTMTILTVTTTESSSRFFGRRPGAVYRGVAERGSRNTPLRFNSTKRLFPRAGMIDSFRSSNEHALRSGTQ